MALQMMQLPEILKGIPPGAWVAISEEESRVLAFGDDLELLQAEAEAKGESHPLFMRVPADNVLLAV